ncbi:unnamed protein product [Jaminaea pallidilutea]
MSRISRNSWGDPVGTTETSGASSGGNPGGNEKVWGDFASGGAGGVASSSSSQYPLPSSSGGSDEGLSSRSAGTIMVDGQPEPRFTEQEIGFMEKFKEKQKTWVKAGMFLGSIIGGVGRQTYINRRQGSLPPGTRTGFLNYAAFCLLGGFVGGFVSLNVLELRARQAMEGLEDKDQFLNKVKDFREIQKNKMVSGEAPPRITRGSDGSLGPNTGKVETPKPLYQQQQQQQQQQTYQRSAYGRPSSSDPLDPNYNAASSGSGVDSAVDGAGNSGSGSRWAQIRNQGTTSGSTWDRIRAQGTNASGSSSDQAPEGPPSTDSRSQQMEASQQPRASGARPSPSSLSTAPALADPTFGKGASSRDDEERAAQRAFRAGYERESRGMDGRGGNSELRYG